MVLKSIVMASTILAVVTASVIPLSSLARAQNAQTEAEMMSLHQRCDRGDRPACVRFGIYLGRAQERHAEWRRIHPEWFWWDR